MTVESPRVDLGALAVKVLTAVRRGEGPGELADELAVEAVLAGLGEGAAERILAGGPTRVRDAVTLAGEVLRAARAAAATEETGT